MRLPVLFFALAVSAFAEPPALKPDDRAVLDRWIARQDDIRTLSADFVQTRFLRALKSPVAPVGRMWFQAPGDFRWEMGSPAKTIVLRKGGTVWFIEPAKRRARRFPAGQMAQKAGLRNGGGMMDFPFAASRAEFEKRFEIQSFQREGDLCRITVAPRNADMKQYLQTLKLAVNAGSGLLASFEMTFRDGSALRNDFSNVRVNGKIPADVWDFDLTGFKVEDAKE